MCFFNSWEVSLHLESSDQEDLATAFSLLPVSHFSLLFFIHSCYFFFVILFLEFLLNRWNSELFLHNSSVLLSSFQFFITHDTFLFIFTLLCWCLSFLFHAPIFMAWYLPSYPSSGIFPLIIKMTCLLWETCSHVSLQKLSFSKPTDTWKLYDWVWPS